MLRLDRPRSEILQQTGSVLIEGLIAILIFSLGILALVGLQASSMKATTAAKGRVDASLIANQRIAELWVDRNNLVAYDESDQPLAGLPNGKRTTQVAGTQVTVIVCWQMPGASYTPHECDEKYPYDKYEVSSAIIAN